MIDPCHGLLFNPGKKEPVLCWRRNADLKNKAKSETLCTEKMKNAHEALGNVSRWITRLTFVKALSLSPSTTETRCGGSRL